MILIGIFFAIPSLLPAHPDYRRIDAGHDFHPRTRNHSVARGATGKTGDADGSV